MDSTENDHPKQDNSNQPTEVFTLNWQVILTVCTDQQKHPYPIA